jgi:hypothetical protein
MKPRIELPTDRLTQWHFAVQWASIVLKQKIERLEELGLRADYDKDKVSQLDDLDMFLQMTWDNYMDNIRTPVKEAK